MKSLPLIPLVLIVAGAQAQTGEPLLQFNGAQTDNAKWQEAIAAGRIEPGMPAHIAVALLGRKPDHSEEVGAACGMLDVLTWHQEGTRLITVDGVVTSVTTAENADQ